MLVLEIKESNLDCNTNEWKAGFNNFVVNVQHGIDIGVCWTNQGFQGNKEELTLLRGYSGLVTKHLIALNFPINLDYWKIWALDLPYMMISKWKI